MTINQIEREIRKNSDRWLKTIWDGGKLNTNYSKMVNKYLIDMANIPLNDSQKLNLKDFSTGKAKDLELMIKEVKGVSNTFIDFQKLSMDKINKHTEWLKNEGDSVEKGAQQLKQWNNIVRNPEFYMQWVTVGDDKVRHDHVELDGVTRKVKDPFWQTQFPGRSWNCRCTYKLLKKGIQTNAPKLPSPEVTGVEVNPGVSGLFFNKNHTYLK